MTIPVFYTVPGTDTVRVEREMTRRVIAQSIAWVKSRLKPS